MMKIFLVIKLILIFKLKYAMKESNKQIWTVVLNVLKYAITLAIGALGGTAINL